jgi:hypothetical protein
MTSPNDEGQKAQEREKMAFALSILNYDALLPAAIEWIQDHKEPQDVFPQEALEQWARAAGFQRVS